MKDEEWETETEIMHAEIVRLRKIIEKLEKEKFMFVARIHNNLLGQCIEIENYEQGTKVIQDWCQEQGFTLTDEEIADIENSGEYFNDDDDENVYSFQIAELDGSYQENDE